MSRTSPISAGDNYQNVGRVQDYLEAKISNFIYDQGKRLYEEELVFSKDDRVNVCSKCLSRHPCAGPECPMWAQQKYKHVVRAVFTPGGKEYNYLCKGAEIGDIITGPGATGPAIVVALGSNGYSGPYKTATLIEKRSQKENMGKSCGSYSGQHFTLEVRADEKLSKALKRALKKARKVEDKERKAKAEKEAKIAETNRLRKVAVGALEKQAKNGDVGAAIALLEHS